MKEFEQITIEEGEENPITQSMRNAITGVQKKYIFIIIIIIICNYIIIVLIK